MSVFLLAVTLLAQALAPAPSTVPPAPLNNGACMDSAAQVPQALQGAGQSAAVVRIDRVVSTADMLSGETIGFLYTRQDGSTWIGERSQAYMSAAASQAMNNVLGMFHLQGASTTQFPPARLYGVKTNYQQIFQVHVMQTGLDPLHIRFDPCVAWPQGRPLPQPG